LMQNKLGLGYQLGFIRLFNQFPAQVPFEPIEDLVAYMSLQLDIAPGLIEQYKKRQQTIAEHRKRIQEYLSLKPFHPDGVELLSDAQMIEGVSYKQIKHIFDWQITDEAQRCALADLVNGISGIEVTKVWGEGKTSGSDGQRFGLKRIRK
jgi:hypothetical protein